MSDFWQSPVAVILAVAAFYVVVRKLDAAPVPVVGFNGTRFGHAEHTFRNL